MCSGLVYGYTVDITLLVPLPATATNKPSSGDHVTDCQLLKLTGTVLGVQVELFINSIIGGLSYYC